MRSTEGRLGRVFVLRLEDSDAVPGCIEDFARDKDIKAGSVLLIGGIGGGQVVVGPRYSDKLPPEPMLLPLDGAHEVVGVGLIAPDKDGVARMHMHAALGRSGKTTTGCVRPGVSTWHVGEVVIYEILDIKAARLPDAKTGFELLKVD
jgi:predicted DNA-binding protein with PD1-like motif